MLSALADRLEQQNLVKESQYGIANNRRRCSGAA